MKEGRLIEVLIKVLCEVATGKLISFEVLASKPYVRTQGKFIGSRYRELDATHHGECMMMFFVEFPAQKSCEMVALAKA